MRPRKRPLPWSSPIYQGSRCGGIRVSATIRAWNLARIHDHFRGQIVTPPRGCLTLWGPMIRCVQTYVLTERHRPDRKGSVDGSGDFIHEVRAATTRGSRPKRGPNLGGGYPKLSLGEGCPRGPITSRGSKDPRGTRSSERRREAKRGIGLWAGGQNPWACVEGGPQDLGDEWIAITTAFSIDGKRGGTKLAATGRQALATGAQEGVSA